VQQLLQLDSNSSSKLLPHCCDCLLLSEAAAGRPCDLPDQAQSQSHIQQQFETVA